MTVVYFSDTGLCAFEKESTERMGEKGIALLLRTEDGRPVSGSISGLQVPVPIEGGAACIPESALREGVNRIEIRIGGKHFPVGTLVRVGSRVSGKSAWDCEMTVRALCTAEKALKLCRTFDKRIGAIEEASHGVDLIRLDDPCEKKERG